MTKKKGVGKERKKTEKSEENEKGGWQHLDVANIITYFNATNHLN